MRPRKGLIFVGLICLMVASAGCSKKPKPAVTPPPAPPPTVQQAPPPPPPVETKPAPVPVSLQDVFFDFDKYAIRDDARQALSTDAKALTENTDMKVLLEGHCDERGTVEYNLALGQKRADAARSYLVQYGVDASRLSTISYGKERPFVQGHDESAWSQNRRVHFVKQ